MGPPCCEESSQPQGIWHSGLNPIRHGGFRRGTPKAMSQSQNILKSTFVLALSRVVERASALLLAFFVARFFGATGLGIYSAAMVYYGIIFLAAEMGSSNFLEIGRAHV